MVQEQVVERGNGAARRGISGTEAVEAVPQPLGPKKASGSRRWIVLAILGTVAGGAFFWKGLPMVREMLTHVTTDDAFVTGDATQVSARIPDQVEEVLIHDNDFVEKGTTLVRLDREPFAITVEQKRSALRLARVTVEQLVAAMDTAKAQHEQGAMRSGRRWRRCMKPGGASRGGKTRWVFVWPACTRRLPV